MSKKYVIDGMTIFSHFEPRKRFDWELVLAMSAFVFIIISSVLVFGVYGGLPELLSSI